MVKNKPILSIDFDGVIHSYKSGWLAIDIIPDPPVDSAFDALKKYQEKFRVSIFSSRSGSILGIRAMKRWFEKWGWECNRKYVGSLLIDVEPIGLYFPSEKPAAFLTIDDRAITFKGSFPPAEELLNFQQWQIKDKKNG